MKMLRNVGALFFCLVTFLTAGEKLHFSVQFSTDEGKTYTEAFPVCAPDSEVLVKLKWTVIDKNLQTTDGVAVAKLLSPVTDFASANRGKQGWDNRTAWYQANRKNYFSSDRPGIHLFRLNLGERKAGQRGQRNLWNKKIRKLIDGPLPACKALPLGDHPFEIDVYYRLKDTKQLIRHRLPFTVSIVDTKDVPKAAPSHSDTAKVKAINEDRPLTVSGDYHFPVSQLMNFSEGKALQKTGPMVSAKKYDAGWIVSGIKEGRYFVRLLVDAGRVSGDEEIRNNTPFLFHNGGYVVFDKAQGLGQKGNHFQTILQSATPVPVKNGDTFRWNRNRSGRFGTMALATEKMESARFWVRETVNPEDHDFYRFSGRISADKTDPRKGLFTYAVTNMTGRSEALTVTCRVLDYFQKELVNRQTTETVASYKTYHATASFPLGTADRVRAIIRVTDSQGVSEERVFSLLNDYNGQFRKKIWLNQDWRYASLPDDGTIKSRKLQGLSGFPKKGAWKKVDLPASWIHTPKHQKDNLCWYQKNFTVPDWFANGRYFINFNRVAYACNVYLNGKKIGHYFNIFASIKIDVTDHLKLGEENHLLLEVLGVAACINDEELVKKTPNFRPSGSIKGMVGKPAGVDEVYLTSTPKDFIADTFVTTSYRNKTVKTTVSFAEGQPTRPLTLTNRVLSQGRDLLRLAPATLDPGQATVESKATWKDPILWGPAEFPLLELVSELKDETGTVVDRMRTRFGFREFWAEGRNLMWNGQPVRFASRAFFSTWGWNLTERNKRPNIRNQVRMAKAVGINMLRHIYNSHNFSDICDEEGMPLALGVVQLSGQTKQQLDSEPFWDNTVRTVCETVRGLRNHPSIVQWYLSNEYYGESHDNIAARLKAYGEKVLKVDDSRMIEFGCDLDLKGFTPAISTHYPVDGASFRKAYTYMPEAAYWRTFDQDFQKGMKVPCGQFKGVANVLKEAPITWGHKPIIVNETCYSVHFNIPHGFTRLIGDEVYESPTVIDRELTNICAWFARGQRDAEVSVTNMWLSAAGNPAWQTTPIHDINILERTNKFYGGQNVTYHLNLTRDVLTPGQVHYSWSFTDGDRTLAEQEKVLSFTGFEMKRETIPLTMPQVRRETDLTLSVTMSENGKTLKSMAFPIRAYPKSPSTTFTEKTLVLTPSGETNPAIKKYLPQAVSTRSLTPTALTGVKLLVVDNGFEKNSLNVYKAQVEAFVESGGTVLQLRQENQQDWLPIDLQLSDRIPSINFTFRRNDGLLTGIQADELSYWYPGHKTGERYFAKPASGNAKTLIESGGPGGFIYAGLIRLPVGKGEYICSQLRLLDTEAVNPVAAKLLNNIMLSLNTPPHQSWARTACLIAPNSTTGNALRRFGAEVTLLKEGASLTDYSCVIWDSSFALTPSRLEALRLFVDRGGDVLVRNITPQSQGQVEQLLGESIELSTINAVTWQGRAIRSTFSPVTAGINNYDLFWREPPVSYNYRSMFQSKDAILAPLGHYSIESLTGVSPFFPALLRVSQKGTGRIILDNLNWTSNAEGVRKPARRIASSLLTNLGIKLKGSKKPSLPANLTYKPVDISGQMNRSFIDEVSGDGKGGWSDQGPKMDLRRFPADQAIQTFNGVPYRIEKPLSCIALKSRYRKSAPLSVLLPVNQSADVLFFLHSCAWTSKTHHASYVVQYEDGSEYEIKLIGGVNLRDWAEKACDSPYHNEVDTISCLAWTAGGTSTSDIFSKVSLYQMAWLNPHPTKRIRDIHFRSANVGVPILVALTAANKAATEETPRSTAAQLTLAATLVKSADALKMQKRFGEALVLYRQAIATAWDYAPASIGLGYVLEHQKHYREAITAYERVIAIEPEGLESYHRIGLCWEALKQTDKAIEVYKRSLAQNINQPEMRAAISRLKQAQKEK
jgi:hypothetical protein